MSQDQKAIAEPSLKVLYGECMKIIDILSSTEEKLNYAVNGDMPKDQAGDKGENPSPNVSIGMLNGVIGNIRRISSSHAKLVTALTGN